MIFGILIHKIWIKKTDSYLSESINIIPDELPSLPSEEIELIKLYLKEWEVTINTQMHFNNLIIRFRGLTLTAFAAFFGAILAADITNKLSESGFFIILTILAIFWITSLILDFGYYHKLLLGAVKQSYKFDDSNYLKKMGFFGITTCISKSVHPPTSKVLVLLYYLLPLMALATLFLAKLFEFKIGT